jgi:hypothetical protein
MTKKFAGKVAAITNPVAFKMNQAGHEVTDL